MKAIGNSYFRDSPKRFRILRYVNLQVSAYRGTRKIHEYKRYYGFCERQNLFSCRTDIMEYYIFDKLLNKHLFITGALTVLNIAGSNPGSNTLINYIYRVG